MNRLARILIYLLLLAVTTERVLPLFAVADKVFVYSESDESEKAPDEKDKDDPKDKIASLFSLADTPCFSHLHTCYLNRQHLLRVHIPQPEMPPELV
jgi:hypothetical protein